METKEVIEQNSKYVMNSYGRIPVSFEKGEGTKIWDADGKEYLDFVAGIAVTNLGHGNKKVVDAIKAQAEKLIHTSNMYYIEPQVKLAKMLVENTHFEQAFFCNSGAEANEAAIKLARKYGKLKMNGNFEIVTMKKSFHGRTITTITATGQEKYQKSFTPLTPGFTYAEYGNIEDLRSKITDKTLAVMIEVIQGEGGVNVRPDGYWEEIKQLIKEKNILLIIDEVQTGVGRTGKLFGYENYGLQPDIISVAKGIANGVPMGVMLAKKELCVFEPGDHASTFGGNFLASAAGIAVVEQLLEKGFLETVVEKGEYFKEKLGKLKDKYSFIKDVRGKGLMVGIEVEPDMIKPIVDGMYADGVLIGSAGGVALRFVPPLTVTKEEIDIMVAKLDKVMAGI